MIQGNIGCQRSCFVTKHLLFFFDSQIVQIRFKKSCYQHYLFETSCLNIATSQKELENTTKTKSFTKCNLIANGESLKKKA